MVQEYTAHKGSKASQRKEISFHSYLNRQVQMESHFLDMSSLRNTIQRTLLWAMKVTLLFIWKTNLKRINAQGNLAAEPGNGSGMSTTKSLSRNNRTQCLTKD